LKFKNIHFTFILFLMLTSCVSNVFENKRNLGRISDDGSEYHAQNNIFVWKANSNWFEHFSNSSISDFNDSCHYKVVYKDLTITIVVEKFNKISPGNCQDSIPIFITSLFQGNPQLISPYPDPKVKCLFGKGKPGNEINGLDTYFVVGVYSNDVGNNGYRITIINSDLLEYRDLNEVYSHYYNWLLSIDRNIFWNNHK